MDGFSVQAKPLINQIEKNYSDVVYYIQVSVLYFKRKESNFF